MITFKSLGLSNQVLKALSEIGFEKPSEIQSGAIPTLIEAEDDFIGLAQTGTGKTAAFGIPLIENIDPSEPYTQALILAPTRELGKQIAEQLAKYSKYVPGFRVLPVYGGANIANQIKDLKRPQHIIIATPGRLIDLIKRKAVHLDKLEYLVLDEADEMLNMGFKDELDRILSYTPAEKLTWLFSATMPRDIRRIVKTYMVDPKEVRIDPKNEVNTNIDHQFVVSSRAEKTGALCRLIDIHPEMRGIIFCRTRRNTKDLADTLLSVGYKVDAIHGDLSQMQRDRVMKRFKDGGLQLLVATDVAARGIDVNDLSHVIHFELPDEQSYYTHRSGRTARAGKKGTSIAFINGRENRKIRMLEKALGISFSKATVPSLADVADLRVMNWCQKILDTDSTEKLDQDLFEKAQLMFGNLSKDELLAKVLTEQIALINLNSVTASLGQSSGDDSGRDWKRKNRKDRKPRSHGGDRNGPKRWKHPGKAKRNQHRAKSHRR